MAPNVPHASPFLRKVPRLLFKQFKISKSSCSAKHHLIAMSFRKLVEEGETGESVVAIIFCLRLYPEILTTTLRDQVSTYSVNQTFRLGFWVALVKYTFVSQQRIENKTSWTLSEMFWPLTTYENSKLFDNIYQDASCLNCQKFIKVQVSTEPRASMQNSLHVVLIGLFWPPTTYENSKLFENIYQDASCLKYQKFITKVQVSTEPRACMQNNWRHVVLLGY